MSEYTVIDDSTEEIIYHTRRVTLKGSFPAIPISTSQVRQVPFRILEPDTVTVCFSEDPGDIISHGTPWVEIEGETYTYKTHKPRGREEWDFVSSWNGKWQERHGSIRIVLSWLDDIVAEVGE